MIERWCREKPDAVFVKVHRGPAVTYADMRDRVVRTASGIRALGIRQGDKVVVWMPNSLECLELWFAINWLGAVYVPINVAYCGNLLQHVLRISEARVILAHRDLVPRLAEVDTAELTTLVSIGGVACRPEKLAVHDGSCLEGEAADLPPLERPIEPWDPQSIIFTSGTTGPSKGVLSSYAHMHAMSGRDAFPMLTGADRYMCNLPLFHVGGTIAIAAMLARGGSIAIVPQFSTREFWDAVRETETTFVLLLGAMASFILSEPASDRDRDHSLRNVVVIPLTEAALDFATRFGTDLYTFFNMSEISVPLVSRPNPTRAGICGRPRPGVIVRLVDENDCEVPTGTIGQLVIRTDTPWAMNSGYQGDPAATAAAWRNGWFHTGDLFRVDDDGQYVFVDRQKDAVRRRGENVSSFEVEREILAHPAVCEAAVVPVSAAVSEDEILCVVAPKRGQSIDPEELLRFLEPRLAHFMMPRYVRVIPELPKTPTQKIEKYVLRREGLAPGTWDRDAAGIRIRRGTLSEIRKG
ncbi:AMP-binding protein [Methylobacterium fujisawaense]|uniref:AMP-binding protein n=1 Tax=Methylobacterium fujisawaense TaxID=107400 RepID=UPI002F35CBC2